MVQVQKECHPLPCPALQEARGALGVLNWLGNKLLLHMHRGRANTVEGVCAAVSGPGLQLSGFPAT